MKLEHVIKNNKLYGSEILTTFTINRYEIYITKKRIILIFNDSMDFYKYWIIFDYYKHKFDNPKNTIFILNMDEFGLIKKSNSGFIHNIISNENLILLMTKSLNSNSRDSGSAFVGNIIGFEIRISNSIENAQIVQHDFIKISSLFQKYELKDKLNS